jgi:hypothetical protein
LICLSEAGAGGEQRSRSGCKLYLFGETGEYGVGDKHAISFVIDELLGTDNSSKERIVKQDDER